MLSLIVIEPENLLGRFLSILSHRVFRSVVLPAPEDPMMKVVSPDFA